MLSGWKFSACYASLPSSLGMRESRLCWGSMSDSSVIAGWQASFDSESEVYEMKTNLRELTTVSFLASPARLPFFHLSKSSRFVLQIMVRVFSCPLAGRMRKMHPHRKVEVWFVCFYKAPDARAPALRVIPTTMGVSLCEASNLQL